MKKTSSFLLTFLMLTLPSTTKAITDRDMLEQVLKDRPAYIQAKEHRIDSIKNALPADPSRRQKLDCYAKLYKEYQTFRFDSAMVYLDRAEKMLSAEDSYDEKALIKIHRALSLATSGLFSQAVDLLDEVDSSRLNSSAREELYATYQWTYGVWAEYSDNSAFSQEYNTRSLTYLDSLLDVSDRNSPYHEYYTAEYALRKKEYDKAKASYLKALEGTPRNVRLYAQAAYGLAMTYRELKEMENYRKWAVRAAISDQVTPLKENLALQELALDIKNHDGDLETANRYLQYSLEDAIFYNNRLRMLEISKKFPDIAIGYQSLITEQNSRLKIYMMTVAILLLGLVGAVWIIIYEKKKITAAGNSLSSLNEELKSLNARLTQTNRSREQYVSLFMDLCAAYIDKLNKFRSLVVLKIKARQFDDLLNKANSATRLTDAEMRELFFNFDTAFLRLYPDFIANFNSLLRPDKQILPKQNELMNTDLRIFALIRMGINDSNKIATLLFYSPQTIFNHRTQVRNRAINRETFEQDLMRICSVMPEKD